MICYWNKKKNKKKNWLDDIYNSNDNCYLYRQPDYFFYIKFKCVKLAFPIRKYRGIKQSIKDQIPRNDIHKRRTNV